MTVRVVAAVVEDHDHFLLTRRPEGVHLEGLWEFPGGKVDPGETDHAALSREIREELGADVDVGELIFEVEHAYVEKSVALRFYRCSLIGIPRPLLGQVMEWVDRERLSTLPFPPADAELITLLTRVETR